MLRSFLKLLRYLVPNGISTSRAAGIFIVPKLMQEGHWDELLTFDNWALASGQLDGIVARRLKATSAFGRWWNVTADRLFVIGHLIGLHHRRKISRSTLWAVSLALFLPEYTIGKLYAPIVDMTNGTIWLSVAALFLIDIRDNTNYPLENLQFYVGLATTVEAIALVRQTEPIKRFRQGLVARDLRQPII